MRAILLLLLISASLLLGGCCGFLSGMPVPPPMNLTFSTALDPSLSLYAVDKEGARTTAINSNDWFYPVQRGLPAGTIYTFRLLRPDGGVAVPANENFTALAAADEPKFQPGVQQYYGFPPGKYTIELVALDIPRMHGTVVARAKIEMVLPYNASEENIGLVEKNCSSLLPVRAGGMYPSMDAPGARTLSDCIRDLAIANSDAEFCKGITKYINDSIMYIDWCVGDYAVDKGDLALCSRRGRAVDRALCRAQITGDFQECLSFECDFYWSCDDQKAVCLANLGLMRKDAAICRMAIEGDYRNRCLGLVLLDKSYCNLLMANESRDSCISYISDMPPSLH
jgi:hypothetical protein